MYGADVQANGNWVFDCAEGDAMRIIGPRQEVIGNVIRNCRGGGISLYDGGGSLCEANQLSGIRGSGITLAYFGDSVIGSATLDFARIQGNQIAMDTVASSGGRGIDIRAGINVSPTVSSDEDGIVVSDNTVTNANYNASDPLAAIDIMAFDAASVFRDLQVERNHVNTCGAVGIRFGAATYHYASIKGNKVRDPAQSVARSAFVWESGVSMVGQTISDNEARKDNGANAMIYGFENKTATSQIQSARISNNHARGFGTAGYLNMQHSTNTRKGNRMGDAPLQGSFTATAGATTVISNSNIQDGARIALYPTNAAAVALQAGTGALHYAGTHDATTFTLASTGSLATGTETYDYDLNV